MDAGNAGMLDAGNAGMLGDQGNPSGILEGSQRNPRGIGSESESES